MHARTRIFSSVFVIIALIFLSFVNQPAPAHAETYVSGCMNQTGDVYNVPSATYPTIGSVPFDTLGPGDTVRISHRATPYFEKIAISTSGTAAQPICIVGVPGPSGQLPIIDGNGATTSANMFFDYEGLQQRGLVTIMGQEYGELPAHINIEGLHIRNAYRDYTFTTASGESRNYTSNAAAIYVQRGEHIRITGVTLSGSGNGLFAASTSEIYQGQPATVTRDLTLEYSVLFGNGTPPAPNNCEGADQRHQAYTESIGMVYQYNYFGPLRDGAAGNNIKDRSSGLIVRYNRVEGGAHLLDIVEAEDGYDILGVQPDYDEVYVYGNVLIAPSPDLVSCTKSNGNEIDYARNGRNLIHFGGDLGGEDNLPGTVCGFSSGQDPTECYRKGPLYFYNNTVVLYNAGNSYDSYQTLFRLQTNEQFVEATNNIIHVVGEVDDSYLSLMNRAGTAQFGTNLVNHSGLDLEEFYAQEPGASITGFENLILATDPDDTAFVDEATQNFRLTDDSLAVNVGETLVGVLPIDSELLILPRPERTPRVIESIIDLGAFEYIDNSAALNAPTNLQASLITNAQINLSWDDNSGDETSFIVERSRNPLRDWEQIAQKSANSETHSDSTFSSCGIYYYRVRAFRNPGSFSTPTNITYEVTVPCNIFADSPSGDTAWMKPFIETFYLAGITEGCSLSPLNYCPERFVTRGAMAVFLTRAIHYPDLPHTPPPSSGVFADVPTPGKEWMQPWIIEFYNLGITGGCGQSPLRFCPENSVTRAAMAVFLLRALEGPDYVPPPSGNVFADLPVAGKEWMEPWVNELYARGITTGCGTAPLRFCPENPVTRGAMAVFILRAFENLPKP